MLKLIGAHCPQLQHLDISSSKQVTDVGVENLCFQVLYVDKNAFVTPDAAQAVALFEATNGKKTSHLCVHNGLLKS